MLRLAAANAMYVTPGELGLVLGLCVIVSLLVTIALAALLRSSNKAAAVPLVCLLLLAWLFDAETLADKAVVVGIRSLYAMLVLSAVVALTVWWLLRSRRDLSPISRTATVAIVALSAIAGIEYVARRESIQRIVRHSDFFADATRELPAATRLPIPRGRDVYLLILDGYPRASILATRFGFDNTPFRDSLEKLGLTVASHARSNYGFTAPSLASLFSGGHVNSIERDSVGRLAPWNVFYEVIQHSRVLAAFSRAGYHVYVVPSAYFPGTRVTDVGTTYLPTGSRGLLARAARGELMRWVMHGAIPGRLVERSGFGFMPDAVAFAPFRGMEELARVPGPKIVIAHSLLAHYPYFFDADCRQAFTHDDGPIAYRAQISCTDHQVLRTISAIEENDKNPTILVLADHGTWGPGPDIGAPAEDITPSQAVERFGAFRATLLPPGITIPDSSTQVNVVRRVVSATLGIELPDVPDSSYWSSFAALNHFVAVDSLLDRPAGGPEGEAATRGGRR